MMSGRARATSRSKSSINDVYHVRVPAASNQHLRDGNLTRQRQQLAEKGTKEVRASTIFCYCSCLLTVQ
jgi:hypothetical protein